MFFSASGYIDYISAYCFYLNSGSQTEVRYRVVQRDTYLITKPIVERYFKFYDKSVIVHKKLYFFGENQDSPKTRMLNF